MNEEFTELEVYARQGFGCRLGIVGRIGMLIVDLVNGFADPNHFGGGNIVLAINQTRLVLAEARIRRWPIAYSRIVFADDASDANIFSAKVPSLLSLKEHAHESQIVEALAPLSGELVVRKTVPSGFFGTGLAPWLSSRCVQTLVICGAVTSGCVRASAVDAMCHGFRPIVLGDCVGDRAIAAHRASLFDIGQKVADVMDWATLKAQLPPPADEE
jgi:maleamate amidohydrolase